MPCFNLNKSNFNKDSIKHYKVVSDILKNSNELPHENVLNYDSSSSFCR